MFERFTRQAREVVVVAQTEARALGHDYIGTEHVLLAALHAESGVPAAVLGQFGMSLESTRQDIEEIVGRGDSSQVRSGHIPFTPRAKKVLELSLREALALGHNHIGAEHILLGLVREGEGVAAMILARRTPSLDDVRKLVLVHLGTAGGPGAGGSSTWRRRSRTPAADDVIAAATALAGEAPMGSHHLLEALARTDGSMAAAALAGLGVELEALTRQLDEQVLEDTTDVTPEESGARQMALRVLEDEVQVVLRDPETLDRARAVEAAAGAPVSGGEALGTAFVPLWTAVQGCLSGMQADLAPEPPEPETSSRSLLVQRVIHSRLRRRRRP